VEGDGDLDLLVGSQVWINDGSGGLTAGVSLPGPGVTGAADLDGDGDIDLVVGGAWVNLPVPQQEVVVLDNDGAGVFTPRFAGPLLLLGYSATEVAMGDFDGNGTIDAAFVSSGVDAENGPQYVSGVSLVANRGYGGWDFDGNGVPDSCE
jgi:hypothetical protein